MDERELLRQAATATPSLSPAERQTMDKRELPLHPDRPPLRVDEGGTVRVGKSRITLDLLVREYDSGMTPEDLVRAYDTLELPDVYAATVRDIKSFADSL